MDFIRRFIEQKISRATGAEVRFGKLSFSPLSGVVEVQDLSVGTFLTVKRIEAKIAVARALKQEIVVRSLAIEGPIITVRRDVDGKINLPPRPVRPPTSPAISPTAPGEAKKSWEFEAHKVLLVSGGVTFADFSGYRVSLDNVTGSVEMKSSEQAEFVFAAASLGRRDQPVELGEARMLGKLAGGINVTLSAGSMIDLNVRAEAIDADRWNGELNLAMSLATLLTLLPPEIRLPISTATGEAKLSAIGSVDRGTSAINLQSFELRTGPVTVK
jgi:hypothetical protein